MDRLFKNGAEKIGLSTFRAIKLDQCLSPVTKINSKWT
jgi:hypothetical protein